MSTAPISPLDEIRRKLRKYPQLAVVDDDNAITVKAQTAEGFDVWFLCDGNGYTVGLAGWHELFSLAEPDRALECFAFGLSDSARIRVHSCAFVWQHGILLGSGKARRRRVAHGFDHMLVLLSLLAKEDSTLSAEYSDRSGSDVARNSRRFSHLGAHIIRHYPTGISGNTLRREATRAGA